jgi:ferredoxin
MIETAYCVYPLDNATNPSILKQFNGTKYVYPDTLNDLICKRCGKICEKDALSRGISDTVRFTSRRSILGSMDDFYVVHHDFRVILDRILFEYVDFYPISNTKYYVACAKSCIQPIGGDPAYRVNNNRCINCNRYREIVWGNSPPIFPINPSFASVNLESVQGRREVWLVSSQVADLFRNLSPKISGMLLEPKVINVIDENMTESIHDVTIDTDQRMP